MNRRAVARTRGTAALLAAAAIILPGCGADDTIAPRSPLAPQSVTLPLGGTYTIPVPPDNGDGGAAPQASTGIFVPKRSNVRIRVTGSVTVTSSPSCDGYYTETVGPQGTVNLGGLALVVTPWIAGADGGSYSRPWEQTGSNTWVSIFTPDETVHPAGDLTIGRSGPGEGWCGYEPDVPVTPSLYFSGSQTAEIDFIAIEVAASTLSPAAGQTIRFTAQPVNFTPAGTGSEIIVWSYQTGPDTFARVTACDGQLTCDYAPTVSGEMLVVIRTAGGSVTGWSGAVGILQCPTGDPVLDTKALQDRLNQEFAQSVADGTEHFGWIYRNDSTGGFEFWRNPGSYADRCRVTVNPIAPVVPGRTLVRGFHTHIIPQGSEVGPTCRGVDPKARARNGPSFKWDDSDEPGDLELIAASGVPHFILDEDEMWIVQPDKQYRSMEWTRANRCRTP